MRRKRQYRRDLEKRCPGEVEPSAWKLVGMGGMSNMRSQGQDGERGEPGQDLLASPALIFSAICSMVSFRSVMCFRSSSTRKSQGEIRATSKSGIS